MKNEIQELRRQGYSIKEIERKLECSRATASKYCRGVVLDDKAKARLRSRVRMNAINGSAAFSQRCREADEQAIQEARNQWADIKVSPRMMAFLGVYWGEGNKRSGYIGVSNSDPTLIRFCLSVLYELTPDSRKVAEIRYYPDHDPTQIKNMWVGVLDGVELSLKEVVKVDKRAGKKPTKSKYGMCHLRMSDRTVWLKILTWLECWKLQV